MIGHLSWVYIPMWLTNMSSVLFTIHWNIMENTIWPSAISKSNFLVNVKLCGAAEISWPTNHDLQMLQNMLVSSHLSEICFTWRNQHVVTFTPPLENIQAFKLSSTVGKFMKASNFPTPWCHSSPTVQLRERDDTLPIVTFEL